MQQVTYADMGTIDFKEAWNIQESLLKQIVDRKLQNRDLPADKKFPPLHYLLFCEHPHVYTLGKSGKENNLLVNEEQLKKANATYYKINRGGDITYHGPGQVVGYPILDLDYFFNDIHKYMRHLEEVIIKTIAEYGLLGERITGSTGVWLDATNPDKARKICAFGVRLSRWVTMHGFALNVNCDLNYFNNIVPCGIADKSVTSIEKETAGKIDLNDVKQKLTYHFSQQFNCSIIESKELFTINI